MIRNYIKTAIRNLLKNRMFSIINIGGLSLGISVALLIILYVNNELSYDKWYQGSDNIYRVYRNWSNGGRVIWTPDPLAEALAANLPEVEYAAGMGPYGETLLDYENEKLYVEGVAVVDSTFFEVIPIPFLYGNSKEALDQPNSVVISRRIAEIYFGQSNPVGNVIRFNGTENYTVTGVMEEALGKTHLDFEVYARFTYESPYWTGNNRATYIRVSEQADIAALETKVTELVNEYIRRELTDAGRAATPDRMPDWKLQAFEDIHLRSDGMSWFRDSGGSIRYLRIFALIAIIVLLIACINYINLSTARSVGRAKEVGIRKVVGGQKTQLISQFLTEASVQTFLSLLIAVGLTELFLPWFNQITNRELVFLQGNWLPFLLPMIGLGLVVSLLAGSYPAFLLASFRPIKVIKGQMVQGRGHQGFRRGLVVLQFTISVVLVIVMAFIYRQVNFMMDQELGFEADQVLSIPMNLDSSADKVEQLKEAFLTLPGVSSISTASRLPGMRLPDWMIDVENDEEEYAPFVLFTDHDYAQTLDLQIVEGRFFSRDHPTDTANAFVVNEAFIKNYNIADPIGAGIKFTSQDQYGRIIGVIKDFHYRGLEQSIRPIMIGMRNQRYNTAIKVSADNLTSTISDIRALWSKVEPEHPMRYTFLDQDFAAQYSEHQRFGKTLLFGTILTIIIAVLGLFGLAAYSAAKRTKEIGIRKVLGATIQGLTFMLVKDFVRWILLAGLIAAPIGYFLAKRWLEGFAYQTALSPTPFILAITFALLIAVLTVSFQAIRAASTNPVEVLKDE